MLIALHAVSWPTMVNDKFHRLNFHQLIWGAASRLVHGNKNVNKATIAVARELVGFLWAVLYPRSAQVGPGLRRAA